MSADTEDTQKQPNHPKAPSSTVKTTPPPPRRRRVLYVVVGFVLVTGVAWVTAPLWTSPLRERLQHLDIVWPFSGDTRSPQPHSAGRERALEARIDMLETVSDRLAVTEQRLNDNTVTIARLRADVQVLTETLTQWSDRLVAVEKRAVQNPGDWVLLPVLSQLRVAIESGRPYKDALRSARAVAQDNVVTLLAPLAHDADHGIAGLSELRQRMTAVGANIASGSLASEDATSWWKRLWRRVVASASLRRVDGAAAGDGALARVARAEADLAAGELAAAVAQFRGLQGPALDVVAPWLEQANARLTAQKILDAAQAMAVERLKTAVPADINNGP